MNRLARRGAVHLSERAADAGEDRHVTAARLRQNCRPFVHSLLDLSPHSLMLYEGVLAAKHRKVPRSVVTPGSRTTNEAHRHRDSEVRVFYENDRTASWTFPASNR